MSIPADYQTTLFINLPVSNLQASIDFYTSLGFIQNKTFSDENAAMVSIPLDLDVDDDNTKTPDSQPNPKAASSAAAAHLPLKVMLLSRPFFQGFLPADREMADPAKVSQTLLCISMPSKEKLDAFIDGKVRGFQPSGATTPARVDVCAVQDHGWMYGRSFADLDGHIWECTWMEPDAYRGKE